MRKIEYHYNIRLGTDVEHKDLLKIKKELHEDPFMANIYLLTLAKKDDEQLEIINSKYLIQKHYKDVSLYVIGISKSKDAAISLVETLMQECVTNRGDANLKAYLIGD